MKTSSSKGTIIKLKLGTITILLYYYYYLLQEHSPLYRSHSSLVMMDLVPAPPLEYAEWQRTYHRIRIYAYLYMYTVHCTNTR